jgi:hypothetical protein
MNIEFAGQTVIISSLLVLWLNIKQIFTSYPIALKQVGAFLDLMKEEKSFSLMGPNLFFYGILPSVFVYFMYYAQFATWLIALVLIKTFLSGFLSAIQQKKLLNTQEYSTQMYYFNKLDLVLNSLLFVFILLGMFL